MDIQTIIQKASEEFDKDFAKDNYMEQRTGDDEHLYAILSRLNIAPYSKVLDLGTGSGYLAFPIAGKYNNCTVIGLDIAVQTLKKNKEKASLLQQNNLDFLSYDGINFPFDDNIFDCVVTRYALHHFPDIDHTFSEISRVLKTEGSLFISDPTPNEIDGVRFVDTFMQMKDDGHVRFYLKSEFVDLAGKYGLRLIDSFDSKIRFPSDRTVKFLKIADQIAEDIIKSYDIDIVNDQVYITEHVVNLLFEKELPVLTSMRAFRI